MCVLCTVMGRHRAAELPNDARRYGYASVIVSVSGIVVGFVVAVILILLAPLFLVSHVFSHVSDYTDRVHHDFFTTTLSPFGRLTVK